MAADVAAATRLPDLRHDRGIAVYATRKARRLNLHRRDDTADLS